MTEARSPIRKLTRLVDIGADRNYPLLLDKNERTAPFSDKHLQEIFASISPNDLNRYPDQTELYSKLARFLRLDFQEILLTVGADSGLKHVFETFVEPGDRIVSVSPSYAMIEIYAAMFQADLTTAGYDKDLKLEEAKLLSSLDSTVKLVVIPNPNQPTGTTLGDEFIQELLELSDKHNFIVLIDEAYIEFSDRPSLVSDVRDKPNLLVLRTFSKAWGLAGVRLGYITGSVSAIEQLRKVKSLLEINVLSIKACCYLLDHYYLVQEFIDAIKLGRKVLCAELRKLNVETILGATNFIHLKLPAEVSAKFIEDGLLAKGIKVRVAGGTASILDGCIRVTVGTPQQVRYFVKEFSSLINILRKEALT